MEEKRGREKDVGEGVEVEGKVIGRRVYGVI